MNARTTALCRRGAIIRWSSYALYFSNLRRGIEYLEGQRREQVPAQVYLY